MPKTAIADGSDTNIFIQLPINVMVLPRSINMLSISNGIELTM